ncbi:hypothetical protein H5P28_11640 [Ruficoccus amylovorans]|uniref:Uncharacterized protein n=1 Tax=Ruficoccus amylovorans TaxID=1804625 RepID=A0A842HFB0_9BACT|nr:hypothetical protein [Ruficoccus amylovorans]MBC2594910.1 hypothetical protein [Ruficoccus amylovorans]
MSENNGIKPSRRLTKAHISSEGTVSLQWQEFNESTKDWAKRQLEETEHALESFQESLDALAPAVRRYREEGMLDINKYKVNGLCLFYGKSEVPGGEALSMKAMVTASRKLENWGPANVNTPRLPITCEDETADTVDDATAQAVEKVCAEAFRYIDGERQQGELNLDGSDSDEDDDNLLDFSEDNGEGADSDDTDGEDTDLGPDEDMEAGDEDFDEDGDGDEEPRD